MENYQKLIEEILLYGHDRPAAREGQPGTKELFGRQLRYNLMEYFPICPFRPISMKVAVIELLWMLSGNTNIAQLVRNNVHIWDKNAYEFYLARGGKKPFKSWIKDVNVNRSGDFLATGSLGYTYGRQWRNFAGRVDQWEGLITGMAENPYSRRHIVTLWNPAETGSQYTALPPCHLSLQFYMADNANGSYLDLAVTQRSADLLLGVPYDIVEMALLMHIVAAQLGKRVNCEIIPRLLIWTGNCVHIYNNQIEAAKELAKRAWSGTPVLSPVPDKALVKYTLNDFILTGYNPGPKIEIPLN